MEEMVKKGSGKDLIIQIQNEIKQQREIGGFWGGYCNLQKVISGDIWEGSTRYVYELLQNAEDEKATESRIYVSKKRAKIVHNGEPFTSEDIRNLCYAASKKDPNESIGYLGVGFRSVFPITDKPEIYSGHYSFRFDKEECMKEFGESSLYYFYPHWIEQPTEIVGPQKTTIILPFKTEENFHMTTEQLEKLGPDSLLFLRHIESIIIRNEENNESRVCNITPLEDFSSLPNNKDIKVGKLQLVDGNVATRFLVFRGTFQVPDEIRQDEETIRAKRENIKEREVSIAFQLDEQDTLRPIKGYMCSFFPLMERKVNFLVHADFIVQAGRIALRDTKWNKWMMKKAKEVAVASYTYFQNNPSEPKWTEQFPSVFEKREEVGEIYEEVFEKPLQEETSNPIVTCIEGKRIPLDEAIKITEETDELVKKGFVKCSALKAIFEKEVHLITKDYPTGGRVVKELKIDDFNSNTSINKKIKEGKGIDFLNVFYPQYKKAMERRYSHYAGQQRSEFVKSALGELLVIDREMNVRKQNEIWGEPDLKEFDELIDKGFDVDRIFSQFNLVNQILWKQCKEYLPSVKEISSHTIVKEGILPKLKVTSVCPSKKDIIAWTFLLKSYDILPEEEIWIVDAEDQIRSSKEVLLSDEYDPIHRWQKYGFPNMNFLSKEYLDIDKDSDGWKEFFGKTSMKGYDDSDYKEYVEDNIFSILKDETAKSLSNSQIVEYTRAMKECDSIPRDPIFVVTRESKKQKSDCELYFPSQYSPKENWEHQNTIPLEFISSEYISEGNDITKWKEFFKAIGVKEESCPEMTAEFGKAIIRRKFEQDGYEVNPYGGPCDLIAEKDSKILYIEVKARSNGNVSAVNFDSPRTKFAQEKGEYYYLAYVINIPDAPLIYLLENPATREGITFEMHIPDSIIENYSEKIDAGRLIVRKEKGKRERNQKA